MYSFPLNSPHQSMIRFNVLTIVWHLLFSIRFHRYRPILCPDMRLPHILIKRAGFQQFFLTPLRQQFSFFQHHDIIRILNSGKPVGNDKERLPF